MNFTIVTIASRPDFLPSVARSIAEAPKPADVDVKWLVKFNPSNIILAGDEQVRRWDRVLNAMESTWIVLLSDDNQLHPEMLIRWRALLEIHPSVRFMHFGQQFGCSRYRPGKMEHLDGGKADGGQILFHIDAYKRFGWSYNQFGSEGLLFRKMYEAEPAAWCFHDELLTYHDRLRW